MAARSGADETPAALEDPTLLENDAEELYEQAPAGYVSTLPGGLIVRINATLLAWTGYRREELLGKKQLQDLLAPGARIYYETHYAPLLQMQGEVREIAVELLRADGGRLPVLLNSRLVRDEAGSPRIVRTTVFNASDRRRYERELLHARAEAESRARAALALAHVNDGVLLVTPDGRLDVLNPAAERILGLSAETALGVPVREVIHEWDALLASVPVGAPGDHIAPAALPLERDGHEQWLALAGVDSEDGIVYTVRDVTTEHRLEELRNDLVATVSHELRTPLTGVTGAAQTLLAHHDGLDDNMRRQLLQVVVDQGERMALVVDQILLTSMLDAGDASAGATEFEAARAVTDALEALPAAERARVATDAETGLLVHGDAARATQILGNLVDNALSYSSGPVRVSVAREGSFVRFTVDDDGPGIPAGERERIFDRFYRLDPAQHSGVGGTGLGLYIARKLAARMDGRTGVLRGDGGTTMYLDLPAAGS
jgi:PAS domain S-box-containing protein